MNKRAALAASAALVGGLAWLPLTSAALHVAVPSTTPPSVRVPAPAYYYWRDQRHHPLMVRWLAPCAVGSGVLVLMPALAAFCLPMPRRRLRQGQPGERVPEPERAASSMHGTASWMTEREALRRFPGGAEHGGVVIGQLGKGSDAPLLVDPCADAHGFVVGGTGTGKTASVVIPTLDPNVGWKSSVVVFDPSCAVSGQTRGMRIAAGQRVVVLGPGKQGINVLAWIDPANPEAEAHVESIVETIGPERAEQANGDNAMFHLQGLNLQACLLADMIWSPGITRGDEPAHMREVTLRRFAQRMSTPEIEIKSLLAEIYEGEKASASPMARRLAGTLMGIHPKTFSGIYTNAQSHISWLYTQVHADLVSNGDFNPDVLADGRTTVYVEIPMATLQARPQVGRTIINALLQAVYRRNGRVNGRVLFILDEMDLLKFMRALEVARDNARKYRVTIVPMWQSLGQITDTWKVGGKRNWMGNSAWQWFAGINDEHTAEEVSKRCGTYTGLARSESASRGRSSGGSGSSNRNRSSGLSEVAVPLIRPEAILGSMSRDQRIVFRVGAPPLLCHAALWFKRPEMAARISA